LDCIECFEIIILLLQVLLLSLSFTLVADNLHSLFYDLIF
jgi:hypothetical protein